MVRWRLGRPGAEPDKLDRARRELAKGLGIRKTARLVGLGTRTVAKLKREMAGCVGPWKCPKQDHYGPDSAG